MAAARESAGPQCCTKRVDDSKAMGNKRLIPALPRRKRLGREKNEGNYNTG